MGSNPTPGKEFFRLLESSLKSDTYTHQGNTSTRVGGHLVISVSHWFLIHVADAEPPPPPPHTTIATKELVINYREGGTTKWENRGSETFCTPPSRQGKTFRAPLLKSGNFSRPPTIMSKTSSYRIKTTPKLVVPPPSAWLKLFPSPFS